MNILIDATNIRKSKAGVGVYAKNLIHELVDPATLISVFALSCSPRMMTRISTIAVGPM